jgi:hypothetical protein
MEILSFKFSKVQGVFPLYKERSEKRPHNCEKGPHNEEKRGKYKFIWFWDLERMK